MRSRWWAGWCEKAIQQSEKMPGMRACDEEERTDRQGHATVEMPDLPAELDDAAARPQTGADAGGVLLMDSGAVVPDGPGIHGRRARPAQADRMVLVNPATHRPAGREAPHGHGRRHVHGPRLVPDYRHRRRERRSPRLPVVRARVQGRLPGPVLRDPHARRADHRRAARRGGGVPGDVARHPDPSPSGACATQHPHRPDLQTPTPGRQGIEKLSGLLTGVETAEEAVGWGEALNAWHERWKGFIAERTFARDDPANPKASRRMRWWTHEEPRRCYRRLEKLVLRGEALRLSRASACRRWAGGPHHEPAGGRRQLGRQERVAQPPRTVRGAHAPRVRVGVLHEDRAPAAGIVHSQRSAGGRESDVARTGRRRLARIRDRRRLERIPHRHEISQRHRLTPRTRPKAPQKFL